MKEAAVQTPASSKAGRGRPGRILNLGSGRKHDAAAINVDIVPDTHPDLVHDLNCRPWPFESSAFDEVRLYDVLEHLRDVVTTMEETHRVCRDGATVRITVPHFSSPNAYTDPTHRHVFGYFSLHYFTDGHPLAFYSAARFRIRHAQLVFHKTLANRLIARLANRWPAKYERRWAWIFPAWFISFELEAVKGQ